MDIFLQYIRTHWYDNSSLNNADLTCKLTTLLALTIALRLSMIEHLSTEFMAEDKGRYMQKLEEKPGSSTITYFAFGED